MKKIALLMAASLGLGVSPLAASAEDSPVSYDDAMKCSALFTLLSGASEGSEVAEFEDMATRWLVVAMDRDGTEDGSKAEAELEPMLDKLIEAVEEFSDQEEAAGEQFLTEGIEFCEGKHAQIADEIEGIEID